MSNVVEFKQKELEDMTDDICKKYGVKKAIVIVEFYENEGGGTEFYKSKNCTLQSTLQLLATAIGLLMKEWGIIG